jgi:hypothetical protein
MRNLIVYCAVMFPTLIFTYLAIDIATYIFATGIVLDLMAGVFGYLIGILSYLVYDLIIALLG